MRVSSKVSLAQPNLLFCNIFADAYEIVLAQQRCHGNSLESGSGQVRCLDKARG